MQMKMRVAFSDGSTKDCTAIFADFVAFERTWTRSVAKFETDIRLTDIAWLAWKSEVRCKNTSEQFDDWLLKVDTIDLVTDDEEAEASQVPDPLV